MQKYHLALPGELDEALEKIAEEREKTKAEIIRMFLEFGVLAHRLTSAENYPRMVDVCRHGGEETINYTF